MAYLLMIVLLFTALFLIVLVLVQRGKGGGLAGAFGGMGGQSAFGTKAGDLFTRITIGVATFWILLCLFSVWFLSPRTLLDDKLGSGRKGVISTETKDEGTLPATGDEKSGTAEKTEAPADAGSSAPSESK